MGTISSQITSLTIVYSTVYSDADQRKHQSSASLAFVRGIHRGPVNSPHKWPVTRKMFPFDDVIMLSFQIPHKIFYPYIERCRFYPQVKLSEFFDIRAHQYFWIAHGVTSCARTGNELICVAILSFIWFRTTVMYIYQCLVRQWWHNDMVIQAVATISISIFVEQSFLAHEWKYSDILNNWKQYL